MGITYQRSPSRFSPHPGSRLSRHAHQEFRDTADLGPSDCTHRADLVGGRPVSHLPTVVEPPAGHGTRCRKGAGIRVASRHGHDPGQFHSHIALYGARVRLVVLTGPNSGLTVVVSTPTEDLARRKKSAGRDQIGGICQHGSRASSHLGWPQHIASIAIARFIACAPAVHRAARVAAAGRRGTDRYFDDAGKRDARCGLGTDCKQSWLG